MLSKNVETFLECDKTYEEADTVLFGAPFDSTTSFRPGTRFGSGAIRHESFGLESYSPYQDRDLRDARIMDSGDLELPFGNTEEVLREIEERAAEILSDGKRPFLLGMIHFDAHTDLREDYLGVKLSHACVIRRCWELAGEGRIHQFGIRSGEREEFLFGKEHTDLHAFTFDGLAEVLDSLKDAPVYFTVDLDVMDPSVFPGTGTPEPGGVSFDELRKAVTLVCQRANVVALDANELSPHYDASGASTAVAAKIVREMLLALMQ